MLAVCQCSVRERRRVLQRQLAKHVSSDVNYSLTRFADSLFMSSLMNGRRDRRR